MVKTKTLEKINEMIQDRLLCKFCVLKDDCIQIEEQEDKSICNYIEDAFDILIRYNEGELKETGE